MYKKMHKKIHEKRHEKMRRSPRRLIYMDHAATTPVDPRVRAAMQPFFSERFGNASTLYRLGVDARNALEEARATIARAINASPEEIVFVSGGSESVNFAIKGIAYAHRKRGRHIVTSAFEHHAVLNACEALKNHGFEVSIAPVSKEGIVEPLVVESLIRNDTILVSVMHANNEIGTIQDIATLAKTAHEKGALFHTDAVQTFGKLPIDVRALDVDLLSMSAHKIYGPKGIGALYIRKGLDIEPLVHGGDQESGRRAGTENVAAIVGFAEAAKIALQEREREAERLTPLRDALIDGILAIPHTMLNGSREHRLYNNVNVSFRFIEGESIVLGLDEHGICASTGSACASRKLEPSHVLLAIGRTPEEAHGSLRLTLGRATAKEDVDYVLKILPGIVERLRKISPLTPAELVS